MEKSLLSCEFGDFEAAGEGRRWKNFTQLFLAGTQREFQNNLRCFRCWRSEPLPSQFPLVISTTGNLGSWDVPGAGRVLLGGQESCRNSLGSSPPSLGLGMEIWGSSGVSALGHIHGR